MKKRVLLLGLILLFIHISPSVLAEDYISHPSNIPLLDNFDSPQIKPGESGSFRLTIENRYNENMNNVTLTAGIYGVGTPYFYKTIEDVNRPPKINRIGVEDTFHFQSIEYNKTVYVNFTISSDSETTQGTYFIRFQLNFEYNNTDYVMKSRGYFSKQQWDNATSQGEDDINTGKIDIAVLGIDGIIPDSSFKVWEPIPLWPLYVCIIPLSVFLCILAAMFYAQEEYNMFPWLDQGFKYWSSKFHQSWRLLKHRFRKT